MQTITSRTNKINDVIISNSPTIYYNYTKERREVGETGDRCDEQSALQIEHDEIWELYCKAKIHLLDQLKHS